MAGLPISRLDNVGLMLEELPKVELPIGTIVELAMLPELNGVIATCSLKPTTGAVVPMSPIIWF
jgi:hypothetical protein